MSPPASRSSKAPKKTTATKTTTKKAAAKRSSAKKSSAKKASAKKAATKKAPAKKQVATKQNAATKKATKKKASAASSSNHKGPAKAKKAGKKAAPARKKRSPFAAAFLRSQQAMLVEERATYTHQADTLQAEADELVADFVSGDAQFDEDGGEGDTLSSERERDLALSAQARAAVEEIDHALAKFELGTYGICEASGEPIPEERLEAIPWARVQIQYKTGGLGRL